MYEDDVITISTSVPSAKITIPAATGTTVLPNIQTSYTSSGTYTIANNWGITSSLPPQQPPSIVISNEGEIYRGGVSKGDGLFYRLEKLERMLGILRRERNLEDQYEPLRELGDRYERACDEAIAKIIDAAANDLKELSDSYEDAIEHARVYIALSKE